MDTVVQGIGYLATAMLALSLLTNNDLRFRWYNSLGCVAFIVYGFLISAWPVVFTNALLLGINLYYLVKIYRHTESFEIIPFRWSDPLMQKFLQHYGTDIAKYFPRFQPPSADGIQFMVLRNMDIASVFYALPASPGTAEVKLDYTIPRYRDYKVGRYIFETGRHHIGDHGVHTLYYTQTPQPAHKTFIKAMGFKETADGQWKLQLVGR